MREETPKTMRYGLKNPRYMSRIDACSASMYVKQILESNRPVVQPTNNSINRTSSYRSFHSVSHCRCYKRLSSPASHAHSALSNA